MQRIAYLLTLANTVALAAGDAHAQDPAATPEATANAMVESEPSNAEIIAGVAKGTLNRARRALALGPTIGAGGLVVLDNDTSEFDGVLSGGLELALFKVPIAPDGKMIKEAIQARAKDKLKELITAQLKEGKPPPTREEMQRMLREIAEGVRDEILGKLNVRAKTFERPRTALAIEGNYLPRADVWQFRSTLGIGLFGGAPMTIGPTVLVSFGGDVGVSLGGEIAVRPFLKSTPRSPLVDIFVRADFAASDRGVTAIGVGTRFLLDII